MCMENASIQHQCRRKHSTIFDGTAEDKGIDDTYDVSSEFPKKEKTEKNQDSGDTDNCVCVFFCCFR